MIEVMLLGVTLLVLGMITYFFNKKISKILPKLGKYILKRSPLKENELFSSAMTNVSTRAIKVVSIVNIFQGLFFIILSYILKRLN